MVAQMLAILVTWEADIGRIMVQGQPGQKVHEMPFQQKKAGHGGMHLSSQLQSTYK
jgi:hypothetical protein